VCFLSLFLNLLEKICTEAGCARARARAVCVVTWLLDNVEDLLWLRAEEMMMLMTLPGEYSYKSQWFL